MSRLRQTVLSLSLLFILLLPTLAHAVPDNHPSQAYAHIVDASGQVLATVYKKGLTSKPRAGGGVEIDGTRSMKDRDKTAQELAAAMGGRVVYVDKKQQAAQAQAQNNAASQPAQGNPANTKKFYAVVIGKDGTAYGYILSPTPGTRSCDVNIAKQFFKPETLQKMNNYFSQEPDCDKRAALIAQITSGKIIYPGKKR